MKTKSWFFNFLQFDQKRLVKKFKKKFSGKKATLKLNNEHKGMSEIANHLFKFAKYLANVNC